MPYIIETLPDGETLIRILPPENAPVYRDWTRHLISVGCGMEVAEGHRLNQDGIAIPKLKTVVYPQYFRVDTDGSVKMPCICCGMLWRKMGMDTVHIGGFVYMDDKPVPHATQPNTLVVKPRCVLMRRKGLACPCCQPLYLHALAKVGQENADISELNRLEAKVALLTGKHTRARALRQPFIDVFAL